METLKNLKNNCKLIAVFRNLAFVGSESEEIYQYNGSPKCALYSNNKGKYYIYKHITNRKIEEYDNYEIAIERYMSFINIMLQR